MPFDTMVIRDGKPVWLFAKESSVHQHHKSYRATVVIINDNKVLLVKDKGKNDYSMPGGGFKKGESTLQAGIREIFEELGLKTISAERLSQCDFDGQRARHKVCRIVIDLDFKPYLKSKEISDFVWWDMKSDLKVQGHVGYILNKLGIM